MIEPTEWSKKYRPKTLDEMVGCSTAVGMLRGFFQKGDLPHACLFHGPSGAGKTTLARIAAEWLGCNSMDFREYNSAQYRGIDSIRDLQASLPRAPLAGPVRVFLLDEMEMLSREGMEGLKKMLEDTPAHCYFMLATENKSKLIRGLQTRATGFQVDLLNPQQLGTLTDRVLRAEGFTIGPKVREQVINASEGSARMLLVILQGVAMLPPAEQMGAVDIMQAQQTEAIDLCRALMDGNRAGWGKVAGILAGLKGEAESTRYAVLGYARACLLGNNVRSHGQAYNIITSFSNNFYDSKDAGLAAACYEILHGQR